MNALDILKADHQRVSALFEEFDTSQEIEEKKGLFQEIKTELEIHTFLEETLLYPIFAKREEFKETIEDRLHEHQEIKDLLVEIDELESDSEFEDKISDLVELVDQYIEDEENNFFPEIEQQMSADELEDLGEQLEETRRSRPEAA